MRVDACRDEVSSPTMQQRSSLKSHRRNDSSGSVRTESCVDKQSLAEEETVIVPRKLQLLESGRDDNTNTKSDFWEDKAYLNEPLSTAEMLCLHARGCHNALCYGLDACKSHYLRNYCEVALNFVRRVQRNGRWVSLLQKAVTLARL